MMSRSIGENLKISYFIFFELSPFEDLDFEKNSLPIFFFLSELSPLAELCPFEGLKVQICNHDISKTITARIFKLGQLIEDDE